MSVILTKADKNSLTANDSTVVSGTSAGEEIYGFGGSDSIAGNEGDDSLFGGGGHDLVMGGKGADYVSGGTGRDTVHGGQGDDYVTGGAGADRVSGGFGQDTLHGGSGDDTFVFVKRTVDAVDTVADFADGDVIELKGFTGPASFTLDGTDVTLMVDGMTVAILEDAAADFDLTDVVFV